MPGWSSLAIFSVSMTPLQSGPDRYAAETIQFGVEEAGVERRVVDDQLGAGDEFEKLVDDVGELRLVSEKVEGDAVDRGSSFVDLALGIDELVQVVAGRPAIDHLDAGYFDDAVTLAGIKPGGFGVENDLSHVASPNHQFVDAPVGEGVGTFIFRVAGVALDPDPFEFVLAAQCVECQAVARGRHS